MGKTRAEIQRAYRERQKDKGPKFLQKERLRVEKNYKPAENLSQAKLLERNEKAKLRNRLSRLCKKERQQGESRAATLKVPVGMNQCQHHH